MKSLSYIFLTLLMSWNSCAYSSELAKRFYIGHVDHPNVFILNTILQRSYQDIGIETEFIKMGAKRGIKLVNSGELDADSVRNKRVNTLFNNIIVIQPALVEVELLLLCDKTVRCDKAVLTEPSLSNQNNELIIATALQLSTVRQWHQSVEDDNFYLLDDYKQFYSLIEKQRFKYALYDIQVDRNLDNIRNRFNTLVLGQFSAHHVINKKHQAIAQALSQSIQHNLANYRRKTNQAKTANNPSSK